MLRKVLVASLAVAAISASLFASRPVEAGSCAAISEKAIGLKQSETSGRALKQLNRKAIIGPRRAATKRSASASHRPAAKRRARSIIAPWLPRCAAANPIELAKAGDAIVTSAQADLTGNSNFSAFKELAGHMPKLPALRKSLYPTAILASALLVSFSMSVAQAQQTPKGNNGEQGPITCSEGRKAGSAAIHCGSAISGAPPKCRRRLRISGRILISRRSR